MRKTVHRFRPFYLACFAALLGIPLAIACGTDVSIPEPEPTLKPVTEAGADTSVAATDDAATDAGLDAADVVCPDVIPADAEGIFATPTGTNTPTCGTRAAPCKTLSHSVTRAGAAFRTKVFAARGTYVEKLTLAAGVEVIGGWDVTGTTWKRACVTPEEAVVVRAPAGQGITVEARDLGGRATLSLLRVESKLAAQVLPGESLYGVVAVGTTTTLVMNDVRIEMSDAAAGTNGALGDAGLPAPASCSAGTGAKGTAGAQGAGAPAGAYDPVNGYAPGTAAPGGPAGSGANGVAAGLGTCVVCGTCALNIAMLGCDFTPTLGAPSCGKDGTPGCGGGAGGPGGPASGGGSNIGVFAWDATVTINGGRVKSGNGGNGGNGGPGGAAGVATKGAAGAATDLCVVGCTFDAVNILCADVKARGDGGAAGDAGGAGGLGGAGGGGGGGSSFAIYQGGQGLVTTAGGTALVHGNAGTGGTPAGGMGAAGVAANRIP
jgi:hypothetical protein